MAELHSQTFYKLLTNFLQTSYKLLTNFLQTSHKLHKNNVPREEGSYHQTDLIGFRYYFDVEEPM